eukprot:7111371-Prymnesium_polylepis.1
MFDESQPWMIPVAAYFSKVTLEDFNGVSVFLIVAYLFICVKLLQSMVNAIFTNIFNRVFKSAEVEYVFRRCRDVYDCNNFMLSPGYYLRGVCDKCTDGFNHARLSSPMGWDTSRTSTPQRVTAPGTAKHMKDLIRKSVASDAATCFYRDNYVATLKAKEYASTAASLKRIGTGVDMLSSGHKILREVSEERFNEVARDVKAMQGTVQGFEQQLAELSRLVAAMHEKLA